jgi:hypothetical protein
MSHIKNFKDWFRVYESAGFKYRPGMAIFEEEEEAGTQVNPGMPQPLEAGIRLELPDWIIADTEPKPEFASYNKITHYSKLISEVVKIPKLSIANNSSSNDTNKNSVSMIINNALYGIYWRSGIDSDKTLRKSLGISGGKSRAKFISFREKYGFTPAASKLNLKISEAIEVPVNIKETPPQMAFDGTTVIKAGWLNIYTMGALSSKSGQVKNISEEKTSPMNNLIGYLNTYNLKNFQNGHNRQYNIKMNGAGYIDLAEVEDVSDKLIMYAPEAPGKGTVARKETEEGSAGTTETTGAQPGGTGSAAIGYGNMKYNVDTNGKAIDANNPEVQRCATEIVTALGEATDVKLDSIEITSSASTSWNGAKMAASNGTGDPSGGKLTDTTFAADKTALGNQYLAWLRGKTFADALKSALGELAFDTESINWKVSDEGLAGGKNISFSWTKVSNPGTTYTKPGNLTKKVSATQTTTSKASGKDSGIIYKYEITWNGSIFGGTPAPTAPTEPGEPGVGE